MSNYFEFDDKIAFHPGYYIKEIIDDSGLTQEDFAKRLDTTPKNLSILIRGEQSLSGDIAMKLSRMLNTSIEYWLNLQTSYDALLFEFKSKKELEKERAIFSNIDYKYFVKNFNFPSINRKVDKQIEIVRNYLKIASLTVLTKPDMAVSFRSATCNLSESNIIKANTMVQIATNFALENKAPKYNKKLFEKAINYALTLTKEHRTFYPLLKKAFLEAGVIFIILPNMSGSNINGATKKIGNNIMLMVNDRRLYLDTFWFSLFHEIGHIINEDYGVSFDNKNNQESIADKYAEDMLIPRKQYQKFISENNYSCDSICNFANEIHIDPGIVVGRLLNDKKIEYRNIELTQLRQRYEISFNCLEG